MTLLDSSNWSIFRKLCEVLGGQDTNVFAECVSAGLLPQLVDLADLNGVLPALEIRCKAQGEHSPTNYQESEQLALALRDNTLRNMQIKAHALKLTRQLNDASITPLFLKGTIALLEPGNENIGFRTQADIDLLVGPEDLELAYNVFLSNGYHYGPCKNGIDSLAVKSLSAKSAIKISAAHHHLPPLVKKGNNCEVELHRHFLPKQLQRNNPLQPLFDNAQVKNSHGTHFLVPSIEHQIIHLVLGKFVHDGHLARRAFPLREACDFINLLNQADNTLDQDLISAHCGPYFATVYSLVSELLAYTPKISMSRKIDVTSEIRLMQRRHSSSTARKLLDTHARVIHLATSLAYSPGKLSAYLRRQISGS